MSNTDTITSFFSVFTPPANTNPNYLNLTYLMSLFFQPMGSTTAPNVGIASAAGSPQFTGAVAVRQLFNRLFMSFPNIVYGPVTGTPYCYSSLDNGVTIEGNTITVQTLLTTGVMAERWFPASHKAYSKPLSDIDLDPKAAANSQNRPACAVFSFDPTSNRISNLAIYFDRWQMAVDLWPGKPAGPPAHAFPSP